MGVTTRSVDTMIAEHIRDGGYVVSGGRDLFMEVMDTTTGRVWMSAAAVQLADFEALAVEPPLLKMGIARASMDRAAFQYSPGAPDEPVLQRVIDGRLYINVAAPTQRSHETLPGGPMEISVDKAHVVGFEAGRRVTVLTLPAGDFVEVVGDDSADDARVLPPGGILRKIELTLPWVVSLPNPTRAFFWFPEMRSFQGPVTLPE